MTALTNDQMKAGRYLRWHHARVLHARIVAHLARGGRVQVVTCTRAWIHRDPGQFRCLRDGVYVRRGKQWDCITYCAIYFV